MLFDISSLSIMFYKAIKLKYWWKELTKQIRQVNRIHQSGLIKITTLSNIGSYLSPLNGLFICKKKAFTVWPTFAQIDTLHDPKKKILKISIYA